jgi:hypothetical protein
MTPRIRPKPGMDRLVANPAKDAGPTEERLGVLERFALVLLGGTLVGLLLTAAQLKPASQGFGTHQQLGLPPCTFQRWWAVRCPACGITTSWSHLMRGEPWSALEANCGGFLLALLAMIGAAGCFAAVVRGRVTSTGWFMQLMVVGMGLSLATATLDWLVRLFG